MSSPQIRFHNTLTGKKDVFEPITPGTVKMYVCGITPYDTSHLGHARCYVFFDTVRRFFKQSGFQVTYIQNYTDIDDKIIAKANSLKETAETVAERNITDYEEKMKLLNVIPADAYPRVTQTIPAIVQFIEVLVQKGMAYESGGDVFYAVRKFEGYGKLSKRDLDELESGARVEVNDQKKDPLDFALWKKAKEGEPFWPSPWGNGRPGWHIECSVMSAQHLGDTFDIHGGGQDLIFPHHENELAQSEGKTGKTFARYWLHNGFVTVNREKMSKSLGNFFTIGEILSKYSPDVVRFFLLSRHYKSPLDFSDDLLEQAKASWDSIEDAFSLARFVLEKEKLPVIAGLIPSVMDEFNAAMADDFNTEKAIAVLFNLKTEMAQDIKKKKLDRLAASCATLEELCGKFLGLTLQGPVNPAKLKENIQELLLKRETARKEKDWKGSDTLRDQIKTLGYLPEDTPWGQRLKKI